VDPYNWNLRVRSIRPSSLVLVGRGKGRVVSTLNVCSVAKCKYLLRIQV
jgi:hypothetical protein